MNENKGVKGKNCGQDDCPTDCQFQSEGIPEGDTSGEAARMCRVVEEMKLLLGISRSLSEGPNLREMVRPVLKQMSGSLGLYRGTVRILNRETGEILIDEAFGLTSEEMAAERIQIGEGVIGQVVKTRQPVIVPDIEKADQSIHPNCSGFSGQSLHRPGATAFLCVPIIHDSEVMGTLSGYRRAGEPHALENDQRLLLVTAQLIAQAARLRQTTRENMDALRLENERLQEQIRKHFKPDNMIGNSRAMQIVYNSIEPVAASNTTVLIRGESGVGKELVAHAIHARSSRAQKPLVKVSTFAYNRFGQPTEMTFPGHSAQSPRSETRTYDAQGRLATQSGPGVYALAYDYDGSGNLVWMSDANGSETTWTYDARNRLAEKRYADGTTWQFTRDAAGNLKSRKDALNRTTGFAYNAFGRVANIDYPTDADVAFAYDAAGRLTGMTDATGGSSWTSDAWNRTTGSSQPLTARALAFTYNAAGQRASLSLTGADLAARTIGYQYDSVARLRSLADSATGGTFVYSYQPATRWVSQIQTPSGSATVNARDALGRILDTAFLKANNTTLNAFTYTYDAAGQRATEESQRGNINFAYNGIGELTGATGLNGGSYAYQYDGIGNRLSSLAPAGSTTYTPNNLNQYEEILEGAAPSAPTYDLNGSLTSDGAGTTLTYDDENRLTAIVKGTKRSEFAYDGLSRRVETREFEGGLLVKTIRYVYDGLLPVEELEWNGSPLQPSSFIRHTSLTRGTDLSGSLQGAGGIGGLLAFTTNGASHWYFADANGNVANLFAPSDTASGTYTYDAFGRKLASSGTLANVNTYGKFMSRTEDNLPFVRFGFPILDRIGHRYFSGMGYNGGIRLIEKMTDALFDKRDRECADEWSELIY